MVAFTALGLAGLPSVDVEFAAKADASLPAVGALVEEFDTWRPDYAGATIFVYKAGTTDLARIFFDPGLTEIAPNPQVLIEKTDSLGQTYGKFGRSIYSADAYQLDINASDQTGVQTPPLTTMAGGDASLAFVRAKGTAADRTLADRFADDVRVLDHGAMTSSASTNSAIIQAAIGAAAQQGGGRVILPFGTIPVLQLSIPQNVVLAGQGRGVTVLRSQIASPTVTIAGDDCGLADLTLDGINLITASYGVFAKARKRLTLSNVEVKRFDTALQCVGGRDHVYRSLYLTNCKYGARLHGDVDFGDPTPGDEFSGLDWFQGKVTQMTTAGIELAINDLPVEHNVFRQVDITDCVGNAEAVIVSGASWTEFHNCYWTGNTNTLTVEDASDTTLGFEETIGLRIIGGQIAGTETIPTVLTFNGLCEAIELVQVSITDATIALAVPTNPIILRDCTEDAVTATGETTRLGRWRVGNFLSVAGTTSTNVATVVWKTQLEPNEVVQVVAAATAERLNGVEAASIRKIAGSRCAGSTIAYDNQTANFTVGNLVQGLTSGATAIIQADSDSGTTGTLTLADVEGAFVNDEIIKEVSGTGQATANGTLVSGAAAIMGSVGTQLNVGTNGGAVPSGWDIGISVAGQEVLVTVTGATGATIAWTVQIQMVRL